MKPLERRYVQGRFGCFAPGATVEIHAPVATVWEVLVDFERYGEWNAFTPSVVCDGTLGSSVTIRVCFEGAGPRRQVEVLNVLEPPHRLAWGVIMGTRALLVANRYQELEAIDAGRTRYTTIDYVSGLLAPLVRLLYADQMRKGFQTAADGLKARSESLAAR